MTRETVAAASAEQALKHNNFDLLRLVFAMMVCLVHISELSGDTAFELLSLHLSSSLAVKAFFVVSGFLIFMSYERSSTLRSYADKRFRRIYPAYILVVLTCAVVLPLLPWARVSAADAGSWISYVLFNAVFLNFGQPTLPGVFTDLKVNAVNGALWTLKIEVMFYLAVPILAALMRRYQRDRVLLALYLASIAYAWTMDHLSQGTGRGLYAELGRQLPGQLSYFLAGAALYHYLPWAQRHLIVLAAGAGAVLILNRWLPLGAVEPAALATLVVALAFGRPLGNFARFGDFSYGVYIVHFPIIQTLLWWGGLKGHPALFAAAAVFATLATAVVLWHGVEKHFIRRGSHYLPGKGPKPAAHSSNSTP